MIAELARRNRSCNMCNYYASISSMTHGLRVPTSPTGLTSLTALEVLETLATMEQPAGLAAIAERTKLHKAKAYRALRALQERGYVDHSGRSGYRLGSRSIALASLIGPRPALLNRVRPVLLSLAKLASAGAALHLRSGSYRVLVLGMVSASATRHSGHLSIPVGERAPLTTGCSGTAILAHLPPAEIQTVLRNRPAREPRLDSALLALIRDDGYAISFSANHPGVNGIAAPLLDPLDGAPLGSIAIAAAEDQLPEERLRELNAPLRQACARLAPTLARSLGANASQRRAALDVTIQDFLAS